MTYDFDTVVNRLGTSASKWDGQSLQRKFKLEGREGYLPLWVADMDFRTAPHIVEALQSCAEHGIFGYAIHTDGYFEAVAWWMANRHGWSIQREWVTAVPGIVPALNFIVRALTEEGDNVIIQEPVYGPFRSTVTNNGRNPLNNALKYVGDRYEMDYEDLEEKAKDPRTKLLILCSPHNPVGRVWHEEELRRLGEICQRHGVLVVADEIHQDFALPGFKHIGYATLGEAFEHQSVTCTAPSKTFNLAGLHTANLIVPDAEVAKKIRKEMTKSSIGESNVFGIAALEAAYSQAGAEWVDALVAYIDENLAFVERFVAAELPEARYVKPEGTYLAWIDFTALGLGQVELERLIKEEAKVLLCPGTWFGEDGRGFLRVNTACPRSVLREALTRIAAAIRKGRAAGA